jgi:hypothetical protein
MSSALLRLFHGVRVNTKRKKKIPPEIMERTVRHGYVLHPAIRPNDRLLSEIEKVVGLSGEEANASFHKSWRVVRDSSDFSLVVQQAIHYLTTYGFEQLGIYEEDTVYVPQESLEIPEIQNVPLVVVRAMTSKEVLESVVETGSGIALGDDTLDDLMEIVKDSEFDSSFVDKIRNRELKSRLYDFYGICPKEPVEYLRYIVGRLTEESLLIKNSALIENIKSSNGGLLDELLKQAPDDLASIFFRYKPLFLAMKSISRNKTFFNRLRKKADTLHKPLPEDSLNSVTKRLKTGKLDLSKLANRLEDASVFRKVRLANALKFRLNCPEAVVYRVRNGRGWASDFHWDPSLRSSTEEALNLVLDSIAGYLRPKLEGKVVYLPENVHYTIPATEKQFTGNFPTGSYVSVPEDLIVGIHWTNTHRRIDLDLSLVNAEEKIGWDGSYRSDSRDILFSGDVTNAPEPRGASEFFYVKKEKMASHLLMVNYFNFAEDDPVPCKIITAQEKAKNFKNNYMVNPNNVVARTETILSKRQTVLALLTNVEGVNRVYFANILMGKAITASYNENSERTRKYLVSSLLGAVSLREVFERTGVSIAGEKPEKDFLDLSPESVEKSTIIGLVR